MLVAGQNKSVSMPISAPGDPNLLKMHGNLLAGIGNMGSLVMPGTPSLPNLPSKASVSPPLSPQVSNCRSCYVSCSPKFLNDLLSLKGTQRCRQQADLLGARLHGRRDAWNKEWE